MAGRRTAVDVPGQAVDAGEGVERLFPAGDGEAERLLDGHGELERIKGIKTEAAADERRVVGNLIRLRDIEPEQADDEMLQSSRQRIKGEAVGIHRERICAKKGRRN